MSVVTVKRAYVRVRKSGRIGRPIVVELLFHARARVCVCVYVCVCVFVMCATLDSNIKEANYMSIYLRNHVHI